MNRFIVYTLILVFICGCAMHKTLVIDVEADKIKPTLGSYIPIEAENVKMKITRTASYGKVEIEVQEKEEVVDKPLAETP